MGVELKHGRVAMLAALGMLVGEQYHPLFGGDINVPSYIAFQATPLENFWPAVVAAIAVPEIFSVYSFQEPNPNQLWSFKPGEGEMWAMKLDRVPGDLGFDPLGLKPKDPKEFKTMQNKELNNGRLADRCGWHGCTGDCNWPKALLGSVSYASQIEPGTDLAGSSPEISS